MKKRRKKTDEKPIEMEHPNLSMAEMYVAYKLSVEELRERFGLDKSWGMHRAQASVSGARPNIRMGGVEVTFKKLTTGPIRAMELLAGTANKEPDLRDASPFGDDF